MSAPVSDLSRLVCPARVPPETAGSGAAFGRALAVCLTSILWTTAAATETTNPTIHQAAETPASNAITELATLTAKAQAQGQLPVMVRLNTGFQPEAGLSSAAVTAQRNAIAAEQTAVVQSLTGMNPSNIKRYRFVPYLALTVNAAALQGLARNPRVSEISEDVPVPPTMAESTAVIGADSAWNLGYDGSGWAVAVLDTGVDKQHHFLAGKVISEACYSTTYAGYSSTSLCPGGAASSTASGSGSNCPLTTYGCAHGTHVSGTVAGRDYTPNGPGYNGVAKSAELIAIQIFSQFTGSLCSNLGLPNPCSLSYTSDQMSALERVYALRTTYNIAAVNMSLGGGSYTSNCDSDSRKAIIDNLRAAGIATVIASGNSGYTTAIGAPACISTAVSVGATCDSPAAGFGCTAVDDVPTYSNIASFISLLAPGSLISSSTPGLDTFENWHGTSMATPHVAGAWAVMKQQDPSASVATILASLQNTGTLVDDQRASGSVSGMRRIDVGLAIRRDSDGDGLFDDEEINVLGTDPLNVDSDGDGLVDGSGGLVPVSELPGGIDMDSDNFVDGEQDYGTSPTSADSDGDGVPDGDEISLYGIDPTASNLGDVGPRGNPDNAIDLGDLVVLTRLVTGAIQPNALESILGDINQDGALNAGDLLLLQQAILNPTAP